MIKNKGNLFRVTNENEAIKDKIFRYFITNQQRLVIFLAATLIDKEVIVIEIKDHQLKNILIKLDHA